MATTRGRQSSRPLRSSVQRTPTPAARRDRSVTFSDTDDVEYFDIAQDEGSGEDRRPDLQPNPKRRGRPKALPLERTAEPRVQEEWTADQVEAMATLMTEAKRKERENRRREEEEPPRMTPETADVRPTTVNMTINVTATPPEEMPSSSTDRVVRRTLEREEKQRQRPGPQDQDIPCRGSC